MNKKNLIMPFLLLSIFAIIVFAASFQNSPTSCSGQWSTCANAFTNDANRAAFAASNTLNGSGIWKNYNFSIPNSAQISSVKVSADFFASNVRGFIKVKVSGDNGLTYGPSHAVGGNTAEQTFNIDVTGDASWTPQKLNNTNFRVNVTCFKSPTSGSNPTCSLDWVPVNVTYTPFDFSLSASPSSSTIAQATSTKTTVTVALLGGTPQNVALSTPNCPTGAICAFSPSGGNPAYTSNFTVSTSSSTPAGTYLINITGSGDGKLRSTLFTLNVTDSQPVASASANPSSGFVPAIINFTGSVSGGDAPLTYFWSFKDGSNSTVQNPQHTFNTDGTYNVTFTATDFDGDSSTSSVIVTFGGMDFSISVNPVSDTIAQGRNTNTNVNVQLTAGTATSVSLSVQGCPTDATCSFNQTTGFPTFTAILNLTAGTATPVGIYTLNISGTGDSKTRQTLYQLNVSDSQPFASASAIPSSGYAPLAVNFTGTVAGGDAPLIYLWNFTDGITSTQQNPQHTFNTAGTFNVSFKAADFDGDSSTGYVLISTNQNVDYIIDSIVFAEYSKTFQGNTSNETYTWVDVNITTKNIGTNNAADFSWTQIELLPGQFNSFTGALNAGASATASYSYNCSTAHYVNATADITNRVSESNEANNFLGGVFIDCII